MKITIKHYDEEVSISSERDDLTFTEFMDLVKRISVATYSESVVEEYWND